MKFFDLSKSLRSIYKVCVKRSSIAGCGLFAVVDILEDEIICGIGNVSAYRKDLLEKEPSEIRGMAYTYGILAEDGDSLLVPDDMDNLPTYVFMNHSVKPNVYFDGYQFKALKMIPKGQELTFSYPTVDYAHNESYTFA